MNPRKRAAPSTSPSTDQALTRSTPQQGTTYNPPSNLQLTNEDFLRWGDTINQENNNNFLDTNGNFPPGLYESLANFPGYNQLSQPRSLEQAANNHMVKRPNNSQALVRQGRDRWGGPDDALVKEESQDREQDEDEKLDRLAAEAKADHAAHRKTIPPFVQKLAKYVITCWSNVELTIRVDFSMSLATVI
jgi:hypothetical protein